MSSKRNAGHCSSSAGEKNRSIYRGNIVPHHQRLRLPPYARELRSLPAPNRSLIVYTGSGAWNAAKLPLGYNGYFVVLPFGDDPSVYSWDFVRGSDALIFGFGNSELLDTIARLGGLLHAAGATLVI